MQLAPPWLSGYRRQDLPHDLIAGWVVAVMLVPQAMAYALLAGLPAQTGLFAAIAGTLLYPLLGTSRYLSTGPTAIISILVASGVAPLAGEDPALYLQLALAVGLLAGLTQLLLGAARLGGLVHLIGHSVLAGFTSAAALVILASQLRHLLGIPSSGRRFYQLVLGLLRGLPRLEVSTAIVGLASVAVLLASQRWGAPAARRLGLSDPAAEALSRPRPLAGGGLGIVCVRGLDLDRVAVIGAIPSSWPEPHWPTLPAKLPRLLPTVFAVALVGFTQSIATARTLASRHRQKIDANRELAALGVANLGASVLGGVPVTGGLSRSFVNHTAGARSGLASWVTGIVVAGALFLSPSLAELPRAVLAAIVVVAASRFVDLRALGRYWRYSRAEGTTWLVTFAVVLAWNVEAGILVGTGFALAVHLWRTTRPHVAVVGRVPGTEHFRNVERHRVETDPALLLVRIDESLYFANAAHLEERLLQAVADRPEVEHLVLLATAMNFVDGGALETLDALLVELREAGVTLHLAEVKGPVMDRLERVDFGSRLAPGRIFLSAHEAVEALTPYGREG